MQCSALLQEMNPLIEAQTVEKGISYHVEQHDIKHEHVIGSPLHLRQILINIAGNAVKYGKNGGYVNVGIRELSCEGDRAVFEFTCADNGRGMSEEYQAHMFEPFSQEMKSARTNYQGTGLGLAIVKKLRDKMGGDIRVTSEKDKGSTFVVTIPLRINEQPEIESAARESRTETAPLTGIRALLVEDNELNMEIAEFVLEQQEIVVTKARNGREAVELFATSEPWSFDVILMDIMMPVMDGLEATREIRKMAREDAAAIPIFAMTANAFHDDAVRSREAGMNEHLTKPLEAAKIMETLKKYIVKR